MTTAPSFRFDFTSGVIRFGTGICADLADEMKRQGLSRALIVTSPAIADNPDAIDPVKNGLGDRLAGVFSEITPRKRLHHSAAAYDMAKELGADVLIGLGGGSSLDSCKAISILSSRDDDAKAAGHDLENKGTIPMGDGDELPFFALPTTLAGADISIVAGVSATADSGLVSQDCGGGVGNKRLMPSAIFHDPQLFVSTPMSVLAGSAMNGFNKGLETIYSKNATPITDATASRGIQLMRRGLNALSDDGPNESNLETICQGLILVQYGIGRPGQGTLSLIHAFGHTLRDGFVIQQGLAHAVITPDALRFLFSKVDGRRELIADAMDVADADDNPEAIASTIADMRDGLGLPSRLRDIDGADRSILRDIAEATIEDGFMPNGPRDLNATADDIETLLENAW